MPSHSHLYDGRRLIRDPPIRGMKARETVGWREMGGKQGSGESSGCRGMKKFKGVERGGIYLWLSFDAAVLLP